MPYQTPSPNGAPQFIEPNAGAPAAAPVPGEVRDAALIEPLRAEILELRRAVETAASAEAETSHAAVEAEPEVARLRSVGWGLQARTEAFERARRAIHSDASRSLTGKAEAEAAEASRWWASVEALAAAVPGGDGDRLLRKYPATGLHAPPQEVQGEAHLALARFTVAAGIGFLKEALGALRRAVDPASPPAEAFRANSLLSLAYRPLLERRSLAPEAHARHLQPLAAELLAVVELHLHTVVKGTAHAHAREVVERARRDFDAAVQFLRELKRWDETVLRAGAPSLFQVGP